MARRKGGYHNHYKDTGFARGAITSHRLNTAKALAELRELGEHVVAAAKAELKRGAEKVVADAKARCPVKTGALRNSIRAEPNKDATVYQIVADASVPTNHPDSPDGRFYYGAVVEFSPKINKPFLYPAMDANRQQIRDNIDAAITNAARSG